MQPMKWANIDTPRVPEDGRHDKAAEKALGMEGNHQIQGAVENFGRDSGTQQVI